MRKTYNLKLFRPALNQIIGKKLPKGFWGALRFFTFGGVPLNPNVEIFLQKTGINYSTGYGMTEIESIMTKTL